MLNTDPDNVNRNILKRNVMKKIRLYIIALTALLFAFSASISAQVIESMDQEQPNSEWGFSFDNSLIDFQEFVPNFATLTAIELHLNRNLYAGNIIVEIRTLDNTVLGQSTINESDAPNNVWYRVNFPNIHLIPGNKYRIYVYSDEPSPNYETGRYFWQGSNSSAYDSQCITNHSDSWPNYDYAFRTYGLESLDQTQTASTNYHSFQLVSSYYKWQEFIPTIATLTAVDIFMAKVGAPVGNVVVEIRTADGNVVLGETIVNESDLPQFDWHKVNFSGVHLKPGTKYRICVRSVSDPTSSNGYYFVGSADSQYNNDCSNSQVNPNWTTFDFNFRTYGFSSPYVSYFTTKNVNCFGGNDGAISVDVLGGTPNYTFAWTGPNGYSSTSPIINSLKAGLYNVTITDFYGLTGTDNYTITQPLDLSATLTKKDVTCFGSSNGTINISNPVGGSSYEYRLNSGTWQSDASFNNLPPLAYSVQIREVNNSTCVKILGNVTITEPAELSASVRKTNITCSGANDGTITVTNPLGGNNSYHYRLDQWNWQSSGNFTGLSPKTYSVQIRDASQPSCVIVLGDQTITQPSVLSATVAKTDVTCNGTNDGKITITNPSGGYYSYEYRLGTDTWQSGGNFSGLAPKTYSVQIRDASQPSCVIVLGDQNITQPNVLSATVVKTDVTCNGANNGIISITKPLGGHNAFEYSIDGGNTWQENSTFTGLAPGNYDVRIGDLIFRGCYVILEPKLTITEPPDLSVTSLITDVSCNHCKNAEINLLTVNGGNGSYSFLWTGPNGFSSTNQNITHLKPGNYSVVVKDANQCSKTFYFEVINPFVVTSTSDENVNGTLRYAMNAANGSNTVSRDTITFNLQGPGPFTIQPGSFLPVISNPVIIDGYSQPNASIDNRILLIELDGTNPGSGQNGLTLSTSNCVVKGLIIHGFPGNGIQITSGVGNKISANSIYENDLRGIDLQGANESSGTVTLNDDGDTDRGPNNLQNFPVLSSLSFSQGSVTVSGTLNTIAATKSYTLEFFANKVADKYEIGGLAYGEGQTYIGSTVVTTDKKGAATFTTSLTTYSKYGDIITATATDPDGNTSEFSATIGGLQNQILASNKIPFQYKMNGSDIVKTNYTIPYTTIKSEIDKSFLNWTGINTSMMTFSDLGKTTSRYASATDNTNLVSFTDDQFPFSPGVLGVSAKTLKIVPNSTDAQIIDADIVINPYYINHPTWDLGIADNASYPGFFDIQSIVTHEIGHVMGLIHSGVYNSVMWFEIGPGTNYQDFRTLKQDDKSWLSYRYPTASYNSTYGSISGNIKYGESYDPITGLYTEPVAGAIVLAINPNGNLPVVHAYSDADGNYLIPGLPSGNYNVYITPLDGSVYGRPLRPGNISSYIYCNTIYTDYPGEFYNYPDGANDLKDVTPTPITVSAGQEKKDINFITNVDKTPPTVVSVVPADYTGKPANAPVTTTIVITFSEPVDISTITDQSIYLETGGTKISGNYQPKEFENNPEMIQLTPPNSLAFNTTFTLNIMSGITDLKGNHLDPEYQSTFTTTAPDVMAPTIKGTVPKDGATGVFLSDKIMVYFSEAMIKSTVENSFSLTSDNGTAKIDCSTSWDEYNTFTLTPKSPLKEDKTYILAWTNAGTDLSKKPLAPGSISFKTIPSASPTVIYLEPGGSLTSNVNVLTCIVADFSEPINTSTINSTSTFILHEGTQAGTKVAGTFEFLKDNSRVIFRPNAVLKYSQTYTVELTGGIADVSSTVRYLSLLTKTFTTAAKPATPHISYLDPYAGKAGSYVTIAGNGFDPNPVNNIVRFNNISTGVQAKVTDASLTNLTVIVPSGAISGPVTVTVNGTPDDQAPSNYVTYFYMVPPSDPAEAAATANVQTGNQSRDGVMDFNGARAFITNPGDNTVTVIENLDSGNPSTYVAPIQVGTTPMKIAINPEGTLIYVTNHNSDNVSVIDITAGTNQYHVIRTINVGSHPLGIVASSDGKVYVANDQTISVINVDPTSGGFDHAIANINTGTTNRDADITVDGAILVVTGDNGLNIIKISQTGLGYDYGVYNVNPGTPTRDVSIPTDAGTAIVTTIAGNIFLVDIVPGSENFGTAYANTNPPAKAGDGKTSFDGLYYWVTNPYDDKVTIYELFFGGGSSSPDPSNPSGLSLREHSFIDVGHRPEGICIENDNDKVLTINSGEEIGKGSVTKIVNRAIETKTITDLVKDLAIALQTMIREKAIQQSLGNMLIVKVNDASKNITLKKNKTAINMLNAFIDKVNELDAAGKISNIYLNQHPDAVDYLIETAKVIICMLQSKDPTSCVSSAASTKSDSEESIINNVDLIPESKLGEIYPNPFSETITVSYDIADCSGNAEKVNISVYDVSGRLVSTLVNENMHSGRYSAVWKGKNNNGNQAAPFGTYFVRFKADKIEQVKQIMLIR